MRHSQNKHHTGRTLVVVISALFVLAGTGILLYPKITDWRYALAQSSLEAEAAAAQTALGAAPAGSPTGSQPSGGVALPDEAVALLQIPTIEFEAYVLEGTDKSVLARGPGHYPDTPLPGEAGNCAIAGHRTMYGHPFNELDLLRPGDQIFASTAHRTSVYRVTQVMVVYPTDLGVVAQTEGHHLTLTTCHPEGSASRRLVVVAELTE